MLMNGWSEEPRSYKAVRNETFNKYEAKARNIASNIVQNSLTADDKLKLKKKLIRILEA